VRAHDPVAAGVAPATYQDRITYAETPYDTLEGRRRVVHRHGVERLPPPDCRAHEVDDEQPVVFDGRNVLDPSRMREMGFTYYGVGR